MCTHLEMVITAAHSLIYMGSKELINNDHDFIKPTTTLYLLLGGKCTVNYKSTQWPHYSQNQTDRGLFTNRLWVTLDVKLTLRGGEGMAHVI